MNLLTNKIITHQHQTSSEITSKNKLKKKFIKSNELLSPISKSIKITKTSNAKENIIYIMNQKMANGGNFDKKIFARKGPIKNYIKLKKNQKNSFELESRDEISTNNLTEILYYNSNKNTPEIKNNNVNKLNINGNNPITRLQNSNKKIKLNLNINDIQNMKSNKAKEQFGNKSKNLQGMKHIKVNTKNKKCLNKKSINTVKKSLNLNLSINNENNDKINSAKRKYSNLTEKYNLNIKINGLLPLKSKTQNYINLNNKIYNSNKKLPNNYKLFIKIFNASDENHKNDKKLLDSKKNELVGNYSTNNNNQKNNKVNNDNNKQNTRISGIKNVNLKQKNNLILNIFSTKKLLKPISTRNKNINFFINNNKDNNINSKKIRNSNDNNLALPKNKEKNEDICYTERITRNKEENELNKINDINDSNKKKLILGLKKNLFIKKKIQRKNINDKNLIKICKNKENKINLDGENIFISQNKKNSHNNIKKNKNCNKKKIKLEISMQEKNYNNYFNYNGPLINKVHVFEISENITSKNFNTNISNNNINDSKNKNSLKSLIFNNNSQKNLTNKFNNTTELTPKKKKMDLIINNNIDLKRKNIQEKKTKDNHFENSETPINCKHGFIKNIKRVKKKIINDLNSNNKNNASFKCIREKNSRNKLYNEEKEFCEMETPILLNTAKLTERMLDAKLNLFEKIKNMKTNYNLDKNKNCIQDNSSENSDIIDQEIVKSSIFNKNTNIKNNIKYIIFLDIKSLETIIEFLNIEKINILCTVNKKCFNIIKPIINKKVKEKIMFYYASSSIKYKNKIKNFLMSYSPLNKLSTLLLHKKYVDLLLESNQRYDKEIKKDLTRTFPDDSSFKYGNKNYNKLYHLLTVYSLYNERIGYAQGINFIAANIILLMEKENEEISLMFLDGFLRKFNFGELLGYGIGEFFKKKLNLLSKYLNKYCPEIIHFLENSNLSHEFFSTNWMLTLFSNSMESHYLFIVWDFLIIFEWKFFMFFIVSVLNLFKKELLKQEQNRLTFFMKSILKNQKFKDNFNNIIDETFDMMNKN